MTGHEISIEPYGRRTAAVEAVCSCGTYRSGPRQPGLAERAGHQHVAYHQRKSRPKPTHNGPWSVFVSPSTDRDGDPHHLIVAPSDGSHVSEQDADWLRELIRRTREEMRHER